MANSERTEKASPKKRREAREKGQVVKSNEVNIAVTLIAMFAALSIMAGWIGDEVIKMCVNMFTEGVASGASPQLTGGQVMHVFAQTLTSFAIIILPLMAVALLVGVGVNLAQVGFLFTTKTLKVSFSKISPLKGFKRMFSMRTMVELLKSVLKLVALGVVIYISLKDKIAGLANLMNYDVLTSFKIILDLVVNLAFRVGIVLVILAVFDYAYQWWRNEKDLRMTKQEVKDEYKQAEGDPRVKGRIRSKQREMGMMRMMQSVPQADVVITNPTHYAVALKYEREKSDAPFILAKGKDLVAQKIKEIAAEHRIEITENKPLAQSLYFFCEVGDPIPEDLYQTVAEILAYVYKMKRAYAR